VAIDASCCRRSGVAIALIDLLFASAEQGGADGGDLTKNGTPT
jgi:hypothetical protein